MGEIQHTQKKICERNRKLHDCFFLITMLPHDRYLP